MMHDPVLDKLREHRVWEKKVKKAKHRKEYETVEKLMKNEPKYTLVHLVKERYPSFMDALKDLDDAITMINLFMLMPTEALSASTFIFFQFPLNCAFSVFDTSLYRSPPPNSLYLQPACDSLMTGSAADQARLRGC